MTDIAGWPHWQIRFGKAAETDAVERAAIIGQIAQADLTDLIVMSHGWNNDEIRAGRLYEQWLGMLPSLLPAGSAARVGTVGVFWPAMLWPDELPPAEAGAEGGAAAVSGPAESPIKALSAVYQDPGQRLILDQLAGLIEDQPTSPDALNRFHDLMRQLGSTEPQAISTEDSGPLVMLDEDPLVLAARFADTFDAAARADGDLVPDDGAEGAFDEGGAAVLPDYYPADDSEDAAAGFGTVTRRLWNGAKEALRQFTYWQMKQRAGVVGQQGLGPFVADLGDRAPELRLHLVGHSFGARLVSFSLLALRADEPSPVRSLTLLEGAFSHFAFAARLPQDPTRPGALSGMMARVNGPLLACYSAHDTAVGLFYPAASMTARDDAAEVGDERMFRWGAIGHDGAQAVDAPTITLQPAKTQYRLAVSRFTNVDSSAVVCHGRPPSGAHSDIVHPELAWAMLVAAGLG